MQTLTQTDEAGRAHISKDALTQETNGYAGPAAERCYLDAEQKQQAIAAQLEELRAAGKKNTAKFKELLGNKLLLSSMLALMKTYGIE